MYSDILYALICNGEPLDTLVTVDELPGAFNALPSGSALWTVLEMHGRKVTDCRTVQGNKKVFADEIWSMTGVEV